MMPRPLQGVAHATRGDGALLDGYPLIAMRQRLVVLTLVLSRQVISQSGHSIHRPTLSAMPG